MPLETLPIEIAAGELGAGTAAQKTSAILHVPEQDRDGSVLLLAHGAGAAMSSDFMEGIAARIALGGMPVLRFNYLYSERMTREGTRRPPDRRERLEAVHREAHAEMRRRFSQRRLILGGKSLGGRISSYLAAQGGDCAGLVFLGYPLHPPGKPERLRSEHFPAIAQPALFLEGSRDALCDLTLLRRELETYGGSASVHVIEEANHDFRVPKRTGRTREEVIAELADTVLEWDRATFP